MDVREFRENHPRIAVGAVRLRLQVHGHLPHDARRGRQARGPGLREGGTRTSSSTGRPRPGCRAVATERLTDEMRAKVLAENERIASQGRRVLGVRPARVRPGDLRPLRRPDGADAGPGDVGAGRRGRPAARRGHGGHRRGEARRHPGPDDHRRPRRHRGGDRRRAGHRGARRDRRRVRGDERRGGGPRGGRDRRDRPGGARAQGPAGRGAQAQGQRRRDDRRRGERRARPSPRPTSASRWASPAPTSPRARPR